MTTTSVSPRPVRRAQGTSPDPRRSAIRDPAPRDATAADLSVWAYERLAKRSKGVVGLEYREVACDYTPERPAGPSPEGESPDPNPGASLDSKPSTNCGGPTEHQCNVRRPVVQAFGFKGGDDVPEEFQDIDGGRRLRADGLFDEVRDMQARLVEE